MSDMTKEEIRAEVEAWLDAHWDADKKCEAGRDDYDHASWSVKVRDAGYAVPVWSKEWFGRGMSPGQAKVIETVFRERKAPGTGQDRFNLAAASVHRLGSEELKTRVLPELLAGARSCLLYSEPGAGSDLAGVRTKAVRDGDDFIINGQKVWTSFANEADYGILLARTDWDETKHKGITFFLFPMKQPGVEIRPINQITGESEFNEIFITDARVPAANIIGTYNEGWKALQTALAYERLIMAEGAVERRNKAKGKVPPLLKLAQEHGQLDDPALRQKLAQALAYRQLNDLNGKRAKNEIIEHGSSSLMSLGKLAQSRIQHGEARVAQEILGPDGLFDGDDFIDAANMNFDAAKAYMNSIGGGSDQIQRNIISERILGLPKETEVDKDIPFRDVKSG